MSVTTGASSVTVRWTTDSSFLQNLLGPVTVTISSECPTGVIQATSRIFTVGPGEGSSITNTGLGMENLEML